MREHSLLMSAPMVLALLANKKKETRRLPGYGNCLVDGHRSLKLFNSLDFASSWVRVRTLGDEPPSMMVPSSFDNVLHQVTLKYALGDLIWMRETFTHKSTRSAHSRPVYRADYYPGGKHPSGLKWTPSIHMPRNCSRISRLVAHLDIERVQAISKAAVIAEGTPGFELEKASEGEARACYQQLWETINGKASWKANPWVFVIKMKDVE